MKHQLQNQEYETLQGSLQNEGMIHCPVSMADLLPGLRGTNKQCAME